MQVGGNGPNKPFIPEDISKKSKSKYKHTGIKPKEEKSKDRSVDNLKSRIRDDYLPKSKISKGLAFPKEAESLSEPKFKITSNSAPIDQTLPLDILKFALSKVSPEDLVSTSQVSKYWGYATLEVAKAQESWLLKTFINFLSKEVKSQESKLLKIANSIDFSLEKDLLDVKNLLMRYRSDIINIVSKLKAKEIMELEDSCKMLRKPLFFEEIFTLCKLHGEVDGRELSSRKYKQIFDELLTFGSFDKAIEVVKKDDYGSERHLYDDGLRKIVLSFCKEGFWDKALNCAQYLHITSIAKVAAELYLAEMTNEGKIFVDMLNKDSKEWFLDKTIPMIELINEGKYKEAKNLEFLIPSYLQFFNFNDLLIASIDKLMKKGEWDAALAQAHIMSSSSLRLNIVNSILLEFVKLGRFDEVEEIAKSSLMSEDTNKFRIDVIAMLSSHGKFFEAYEIAKIIPESSKDTAYNVISMHAAIRDKDLDNAATLALKVGKHLNAGAVHSITFDYISEKLIETGQNPQLLKAIKVAYLIKDKAMQAKVLERIDEILDQQSI